MEELQGVVLGNNHFPYKQVFTARVGSLKTQEEKLKKYVAVRPDATSYTQLSKVIHFIFTWIYIKCVNWLLVSTVVHKLENTQ